jgi:hypothetical protein
MPPAECASQVAHQVSHLLSARVLPEQPTWLSEGLAIADTVEHAKSDETRCSGSAEGAVRSAFGGFQAGQIQDFRILPGMPAERSPFRRGPSTHYFTKELRRAHEEKGFKVVDFQSGKSSSIGGPFLHPREKLPEPVVAGSDGLKAGYAEFFRAYVGAFARFFLDQKVDQKPLVTAMASALRAARERGAPTEGTFHDALASATGRTLGASETDAKKDWEAAFLAWILKG